MSKKKWYRQCRYRRVVGDHSQEGVSWLPEALAVVGKPIYFGTKEDRPPQDEMWIVTLVGDNRRDQKWLTEKRNADKKATPSLENA